MLILGSRGNAIISIQVRKSLISTIVRGMLILHYKISVTFHEKLMTLSMASTPGMARVTKGLIGYTNMGWLGQWVASAARLVVWTSGRT